MANEGREILVNELMNGSDTGQIVEKAARVLFDNPVMVTNATFRVVAMASDVEVDDRVWEEGLKYHCCSAEAVAIFSKDAASRKLFFGDQAFVYDTSLGEKMPRILKKIIFLHADGTKEVLGYAIIFACKHMFRENDIELAEHFGKVLSLSIRLQMNQARLTDTIIDHMILQLLEHGYGRMPEINSNIQAAGWRFQPLFFCMSVELPGSDHGEYYIAYIRNELEQGSKNIHTLVYRDRIFLLANFSKLEQGEIIRGTIQAILEQHGISAGISRNFHFITELYTHYEQARVALGIGNVLNEKTCLFYYENLWQYHMFLHMSGEELRGLLSPDYVLLEHFDQENSQEYIKTLSAFYLSGLNMNHTARVLHIHRNTIYYRLERIQDIVAGDVYNIAFLNKIHLDSQITKWLGCLGDGR